MGPEMESAPTSSCPWSNTGTAMAQTSAARSPMLIAHPCPLTFSNSFNSLFLSVIVAAVRLGKPVFANKKPLCMSVPVNRITRLRVNPVSCMISMIVRPGLAKKTFQHVEGGQHGLHVAIGLAGRPLHPQETP